MLKHFLNPPNWFTSASIFCGLYSILLAAGNDGDPATFYKAGVMIVFAGIFDMLDGRVARMTGTSSEFGIQLDSLADAISFGAAPAILLYAWGLEPLGMIGLAGSFFFMLCGLFRLARFNLGADGKAHDTSQGLTITMAGGTAASMVMAHVALGKMAVANPVTVLGMAIVMGLMMVSEVPYRTLRSFRLRFLTIMGLALWAGVAISLAIIYKNIAFWFFTVGIVYVWSGPLESLLFYRQRRAAPGVTLDDEDYED